MLYITLKMLQLYSENDCKKYFADICVAQENDQVKKWIQCYDYAYGALILQGNKIFIVTNVSEWQFFFF